MTPPTPQSQFDTLTHALRVGAEQIRSLTEQVEIRDTVITDLEHRAATYRFEAMCWKWGLVFTTIAFTAVNIYNLSRR